MDQCMQINACRQVNVYDDLILFCQILIFTNRAVQL